MTGDLNGKCIYTDYETIGKEVNSYTSQGSEKVWKNYLLKVDGREGEEKAHGTGFKPGPNCGLDERPRLHATVII